MCDTASLAAVSQASLAGSMSVHALLSQGSTHPKLSCTPADMLVPGSADLWAGSAMADLFGPRRLWLPDLTHATTIAAPSGSMVGMPPVTVSGVAGTGHVPPLSVVSFDWPFLARRVGEDDAAFGLWTALADYRPHLLPTWGTYTTGRYRVCLVVTGLRLTLALIFVQKKSASCT
jgi:hypothetical protein